MFRGEGAGLYQGDLPVVFDSSTLQWHARFEGAGQSSPVIRNSRVYTTSASYPMKSVLKVMCHDLETGECLWTTAAVAGHVEESSPTVSVAAPTPCVDDSSIYALFENGDVMALELDGAVRWRTDLAGLFGPAEGNHGQGASPVLTSAGLVVVMDHLGSSYMVCLDTRTGAVGWKTDRETRTAWSSPVVATVAGVEQVVTSASGRVTGYRVDDGTPLWEMMEITGNTTPSPVISGAGEWLALGSSRRNNTRLCRFVDGQPEVVWRASETSMGFASPIIAGNQMHVISKAGILYSYALESGELLHETRLMEDCWASPLSNEKLLWFFHQRGGVSVLDIGTGSLVQENPAVIELDRDDVIYGVAAADGKVLMRHRSGILCFSSPDPDHSGD